jgi:hypothetical protein
MTFTIGDRLSLSGLAARHRGGGEWIDRLGFGAGEELFAALTRQEDPRVLGRGDVFDHDPSPQPAAGERKTVRPAPP